MASPFKFFRKHQTELLVVIGLLTMVAFIILPSILQQLDVVTRTHASSNVVETQKYGPLSSADMRRLKNHQEILMRFARQLFQAYQLKMNEMYQSLTQEKMGELYTYYMGSMRASQLLNQIGDTSDRVVVRAWLLENKAREMGFSINDNYISSFISEYTAGLDEAVVNRIIYGDETQRNNSAENALFDALNGFLLRERVVSGVLGSPLGVTTFGDRLDSFCRLNQKANIEVYPVKVEDFIANVKEPTESEIRTFFEQYKDQDANIRSSEPGLRQPQKIVLEYCYGSYVSFMDEAAITDEQVEKSYEEHKDNYVIEQSEDSLGQMPNLGLPGADGKRYRVLDDALRAEIRNSLAIVEAKNKFSKAIGIIQNAMNEYSAARDDYELSADKSKAEEPQKLDLAALAKANNLEYVCTTLMTEYAFAESPLGDLRLKDVAGSVDAASEFYGNSAPALFQAKVFVNAKNENEEFVVWKTQDVAEHTPTLDEEGIKQQVVDQIKYREARKLAEVEAENQLKKAREAQNPVARPLKDCLGEAAFFPTQFSMMTLSPVQTPGMQPRISLSPIDGVQDVGFEFMCEIFQMKAGEFKFLANESKSVYYIVRMVDLSPSVDQLYARFCITPENEYASAGSINVQYYFMDLFEKLEKEAGLKWVVRPDEDTERY